MTEIPEHLRRRAEEARLAVRRMTARDVQQASLPLRRDEVEALARGSMTPGDPRPCVIAGGTNIAPGALIGPFENQELADAYYRANQPQGQKYISPPHLKAVVAPNEASLEKAREMVKDEED